MALFALPLTFAEYFAGIGLVRMGLESSGWRVSFANDISEKKFEMYRAFFPDAAEHYLVGDIFDVPASRVPIATLATCSFPCIDLSFAGNMNGLAGQHSSAFWGFVRILRGQGISAPSIVLVENVPGWLSSNDGKDFRLTVHSLNELGYACDVFVLNAQSFTPQSRPRVFLVGARIDSDKRALEAILLRKKPLLSDRLQKSLTDNRDLNWMYLPIPPPPVPFKRGLHNIVEHMDESDERWWPTAEVKRHLRMMEESHLSRVLQLSKGRNYAYRTFFRRRRDGKQRAEVRDDEIAGCLRTAVGGSGKQFLIRAGMDAIKMRAMTPREYARLQGVPDKFPITVDGVQALTGFGDAVCVPAVSWIAQNALNPLVQRVQAPIGVRQIEWLTT